MGQGHVNTESGGRRKTLSYFRNPCLVQSPAVMPQPDIGQTCTAIMWRLEFYTQDYESALKIGSSDQNFLYLLQVNTFSPFL